MMAKLNLDQVYRDKDMKILINCFLVLLVFILFENKSYSLTDYQIKELCKKERRKLNCIRNYQIKRLEFLKGNRIEIPVIPFRK